jgi:hypothetical protein
MSPQTVSFGSRRITHGEAVGFFLDDARRMFNSRRPRMQIPTRIALGLAVAVVLASCAHNPRMQQETQGISQLRMEYVQHNPSGMFNDYIMRGEIVKGMGLIEVVAAWGMPNLIRSWEDSGFEYWTYYALDEHTRQYTRYELIFGTRTLKKWVVTKNVAGAGGLPPLEVSRSLSAIRDFLSTERAEEMGGDSETLKK